MAKKKAIQGAPMFREDQSKCMSWCINNGIRMHINMGEEYSAEEWTGTKKNRRKITVKKIKNTYEKGLVKIAINNNGVYSLSPKLYSQQEANVKMSELYCYFYDKNN